MGLSATAARNVELVAVPAVDLRLVDQRLGVGEVDLARPGVGGQRERRRRRRGGGSTDPAGAGCADAMAEAQSSAATASANGVARWAGIMIGRSSGRRRARQDQSWIIALPPSSWSRAVPVRADATRGGRRSRPRGLSAARLRRADADPITCQSFWSPDFPPCPRPHQRSISTATAEACTMAPAWRSTPGRWHGVRHRPRSRAMRSSPLPRCAGCRRRAEHRRGSRSASLEAITRRTRSSRPPGCSAMSSRRSA